jgi:hypothetical protein
MGIGPRTKGDIKTSIKKHAYPKPTHKPQKKNTKKGNLKIHHTLHPSPPPNLVEFCAFKRSPIWVEYLKEAQF